MKVDNPRLLRRGEVLCDDCPFDSPSSATCTPWWYRNGDSELLDCPTAETYTEACQLAEKAKDD